MASENGRRPPNTVTYREGDAADLCAKLSYVTDRYDEVKKQTQLQRAEDNIVRTADWLLRDSRQKTEEVEKGFAYVR